MFELLMFDLDGTLIDSRKDIAASVNLALDELSMPRREAVEIYGYIGGGVHNLMRKSMQAGREDLLEKAVDLFWANYKDHVLDSTTLYPGVYDMLEKLSGLKMAVVTNKPCLHSRLILQGLDITKYFISIQGWKTEVRVKPDPDMLYRAMEEAGVPPEESVMIGDSVADVLASRAAGVKCCAVGYGYGVREKVLEAAPDYFVENVGDIPGIMT